MKTLSKAWHWYTATKKNLRLLERLARKYWDLLPGDSEIWKDDHFRTIDAPALIKETRLSLEDLDDLAIVFLFSAFESQVRTQVLGDIAQEKEGIKHPILQAAAQEAADGIDRGSFSKVLDSVKALDHDLVEQVRQVRRYRNWISHGKRGQAPPSFDPKAAYGRLKALLKAIDQAARGREQA